MRGISWCASKFCLVQKLFLAEVSTQLLKRKVIGGIGLQTHPHSCFLDLPIKTSLKGWHKPWFYYENHEPSLPHFIGRLPEFSGTWSKESTPVDLPIIADLGNLVNDHKSRGLTCVCMAAHWLACWVMPLKKQVHPGWEYSGVQDPTWETSVTPRPKKILELLR
jgi:hypothetical protein